MASRSRTSQPKTVRQSTALLLAALTFAAGLTLGAMLPSSKNAPAPTPAAKADDSAAHIAEIERTAQQQPDNADVWIHLGNAYYDAHQPAQAASAYEKALAITPDNADVHTDLGTSYRLLGKYEQAIAHYDEALARQPRHHNARLNRGIVLYYDLGRKQEALEAWNRLLQLAPDAKGPDKTPLKDYIARHSAQ